MYIHSFINKYNMYIYMCLYMRIHISFREFLVCALKKWRSWPIKNWNEYYWSYVETSKVLVNVLCMHVCVCVQVGYIDYTSIDYTIFSSRCYVSTCLLFYFYFALLIYVLVCWNLCNITINFNATRCFPLSKK